MKRFFNRVTRVLQLDPTVYSEILGDHTTLTQSMIVVILSSLSTGIGHAGGYTAKIPMLSLAALVAWVTWVLLTYILGSKLFPNPGIKTELITIFRMMGFACAPALFKALGFFPAFSFIILSGTTFWMIGGAVIATHQTFRCHSLPRAITIGFFGWACYQWVLFQA